MIRWGEPLWLLALILPLTILVFELFLRGYWSHSRKRFASLSLWDRLSPNRSNSLRRAKRILFIVALTFLVIALANPQIGTRWEEVTREGIDIFLLVDVSRSMDTQDIRPSRITKTGYELRRFIQGLQGDRVGLIPFSGVAYPLCPLTLDYSAASMFLNLLNTNLIPTPGTAISDAIDQALTSFPRSEENASRTRVIILVSDGEDHEGGAIEAAERAHEQGVIIYTVGMGLNRGDPIPVLNDNGQPSGWVTDEEGRPVTSRLNEDLLRQIARTTSGAYFRATQGGDEFRSIYRQLFGMDREELTTQQITDFEDRFQVILAIAIFLFFIEFLLPAGWWRKK